MATGHFSGKFLPKIAGSGHAGSNDTGLKSVSRPGAEPIECQTHTQNTSIIYIDSLCNRSLTDFEKNIFMKLCLLNKQLTDNEI